MFTTLNAPAASSAFPPWRMEHDAHWTPERSGWPLLTPPIPAGAPMPLSDEIEWFPRLDEHLVRNPAQTFLLRVAGEALAEAGIHDGDLLVMDRAVPPLAGNVVLAVVNSAFVLTRLSRNAAGQRVMPWMETADSGRTPEDVAIAGVARWVIHRLWPGRPGTA